MKNGFVWQKRVWGRRSDLVAVLVRPDMVLVALVQQGFIRGSIAQMFYLVKGAE